MNRLAKRVTLRHRVSTVFVLILALAPAGAVQARTAPRAAGTVRASQVQSAAGRADVRRFGARVGAILAQTHSRRAYWGILVVDRETGETLYELNADHFFTPASNAKIFTTALALATLGPDYRFHTRLESSVTLGPDGRLGGDLILVAGGDPDLSNRKFPYTPNIEREGPVEKILAELADAAVAKGLRQVDGDIVADDSHFPYDPYPAGWSVGDLFFTFGAPVGAIAFNDNIVSVEISPGPQAGEPATIVTQPAAGLAMLSQEVTTTAAEGNPQVAVVRQAGPNFVLVRGTIPAGHEPMRLDLAMTAPAETAGMALKQLLQARGVHITGGTQVRHAAPPETTPEGEPILPTAVPTPEANNLILAEHVSPPLLESVRLTNKISQNLHAEIFLREVGREKLGVGSTAAGLKVERGFLRSAGIADGEVILSDGSGLSRDDLVTPRAMVTLLRYAARQGWGRDFLSTLPIAGVDGTLQDRMRNTQASGRIEAKTGAVEHIRSLSGYATTLRGESLVFVIFCNNDPQKGPQATEAPDAIATAMVELLGDAAPPRRK
jgi:serine-type D-Ala-D-Ala carboxypeptidase/endopeptidase (penicillin-binding protein 4)